MPSAADREGRRTIFGYTSLGSRGRELPGHTLVRTSRRLIAQQVPACTVAHTSLLDDPTALIVDYSSAECLTSIVDYCDQLLPLSAHRGALLTSTPQNTWERALTRLAEAGGPKVTRIAWRSTTRGGHTWAEPQTLQALQQGLLANRWEDLVGTSRTAVHVQVRGDTTDDPLPWARWLADVVVRLLPTAGAWTLAPLGSPPTIHSITPMAGLDYAWDGGLVLCADSPEEAQTLAIHLNSLCVGGASGPTRVGIRLVHDLDEGERPTAASSTTSTRTSQGRRQGKDGRGRRAGRPPA